jgi:hypothetical protein
MQTWTNDKSGAHNKGKGKTRDVTRQTTLFGHGVRTSGAPKLNAPHTKSKPGTTSSLSASPQLDETQMNTEEVQDDTNSQANTDITPDIISGTTTIPAEDEDEEPMEWPESPGTNTMPLPVETP